jgi:osmotically inducible protein OsmC
MKRFGSEAWNGGLREGKGSVSTESRLRETYPYTFFSRYGEKPGTNPEALLWAAHAACLTMPLVRLLSMANFVPEQVDSNRRRHRHGPRWLFHHLGPSHRHR